MAKKDQAGRDGEEEEEEEESDSDSDSSSESEDETYYDAHSLMTNKRSRARNNVKKDGFEVVAQGDPGKWTVCFFS